MTRTPISNTSVDDPDRHSIARRRLVRVLDSHGAATQRILEQKISDAGPGGMRVDPHILTPARRELQDEGVIAQTADPATGIKWFYLARTPYPDVKARLDVLQPIQRAMQQRDVLHRVGQALEIATYRGLIQHSNQYTAFFGGFPDLALHDDSRLYSRTEPPNTLSGRTVKGFLDYLILTPHGAAAIEVKNIREWLYPDRAEVRELLRKACGLDAVPVLIGRRIPFVTRKLLTTCGGLVHETYNQRFAEADRALAEQAADKKLMGFHDIRIGNLPDDRLLKFLGTNLPAVMERTRETYDRYQALLAAFGNEEISYPEFAARVRRRTEGQNEDRD